jgi:hypothetical protein
MAATTNVEQGKAFVKVLAAVLTRLVNTNDEVRQLSLPFHSSTANREARQARQHAAVVASR